MQGMVAAWSRLVQQTSCLEEEQCTLSSATILNHKGIVKALSILPDNILIDFITWFHSRSQEELQAIQRVVLHTPEDRISFFNRLGYQILDDDELYQNGAIFTPNWLTAELTQSTLEHWKKLNPDRESPMLVGDLSCGPGAFLLEMDQRLPRASTIVGVDKNIEFTCLARLAMLGRQNVLIEARDTLLDIHKQQSLFASVSPLPTSGYDILIGNPPYVRSQALASNYAAQLKQSYPTLTKGNFDLVVLFLAHTLESLAPGGIGSLVVSNKFMTSRYGAAICHKLAEQARILEIVNFGDGQVFPHRTTYTCTITFAKLPPAKHFLVTSFPPGLDWRGDVLHFDLAQKTALPHSRLLSHPWNLSNDSSSEILQRMQASEFPGILDIFRDVCQGVRTGANQVFLVHQKDIGSLEEELLQPHVNGQNIKRCQILPADHYLLYPYRFNAYDSIEIIPPSVLEQDFPGAWGYLLRHRDILAARELGPGIPWYSYSRVQNLEIQRRPKILVKEMMPRAEFAADTRGQFTISAGYALIAPPAMNDLDLELWAAVLSTPTMEFQYRLIGTQLHSGWFRLLGHHLKKIKLPLLQGQSLRQARILASQLREKSDDGDIWRQLDDLVAQNFKLTSAMQTSLREILSHAHSVSRPGADLRPGENAAHAANTAYPELNDEQRRLYVPIELPQFNPYHIYREDLRQAVTFVPNKEVPVHNWYNYTQGFSETLVRKLIAELGVHRTDTVYDPFTGCGTTLLTCQKMGIASFGTEISPLMTWITSLKTSPWDPARLEEAVELLKKARPHPQSDEQLLFPEYFRQAYSPGVLKQLIGWRDWIQSLGDELNIRNFLMLGLVSILEEVSYIRKHGSHYRYLNKDEDESVGLKKLNIPLASSDIDVKPILVERIKKMIADTKSLTLSPTAVSCEVFLGDGRGVPEPERQADAVITSPPYLNRNNYIAQQKAELALLRLLSSYDDYRQLVRRTLRSHVESDLGAQPETTIPEVARVLEAFTLTPNNNAKIPHMIAGYFEDLKRTLNSLFEVVRPGGKLAFVVGNSRWGGVVVPVDHLLALLAEQRGFIVERILVTRLKGNSPQQMQRYGRIPVRESIVLFRRP